MDYLGKHTSLIAVKEGDKVHVKVYYSREGTKRYKTNVYVKNKAQFDKGNKFTKNNSLNPQNFKDDEDKIIKVQGKIERIIQLFFDEHLDKPTAAQLDDLIANYKEESQRNYTFISDYLAEYVEIFEEKNRNSKSVVKAFASAYTQFCQFQNRNYKFNDINEKFLSDLIDYFLLHKPKSTKYDVGKPNHLLSKSQPEQSEFDTNFGMNNNTLLKRLDAFRSFILWAQKMKGINIKYDTVSDALKKVKSEKKIVGYTNIEFAFKKREDLKLLASEEFESIIKDDIYIEHSKGKKLEKGVSKELLVRAKDYFVVSILTANRISDLRNIKRHHIELGKQKAKKTNAEFLLNSNQTIVDLLEKNSYDLNMNDGKYNKCIKVFLRQFFTEYLKKVDRVWVVEWRGEFAQYKEVEYYSLAGSHSGRRSFASILYNEGRYPKRKIMQFTGHSSEREFDKYIQLSPEEDIQEVSDFMNINYN
ncbi:phage integrase SAM-like domain-containing protein [Pontibacter vulgaris]|uniref:phage integrase SAM-like domain-containing protein n=1 Tax=Pontibacter vulgaris TaxID=2905679 RepID=UPI001FA6F4F9|nr:phage integrase SAM-like domain-containing protein [Pontibacter vulgaris]